MNKKEEVLNELGGIAKELGIDIDYVIDNANHREYLVCDDTKICTNATSIHGIRQEFFGYVFLKEWHNRQISPFETQTRNYIKRYWFDDNFNQPYISNVGR